ncbi:hypothetical protein [Scytonema hofmannii]|uniref:hypothetical protein n=1 Tax=Scytonema hofmannii TaxID=34078 RepID=UPI00034D39AC|nr:hypothetical protein [Scytonema hofmannii]
MLRKRFVIIVGDARVGKSTTSRLLLDLYAKNKLNVRAFYHGHRNKLSMYQTEDFKIDHLGFSRGDSDRLLLDLDMFPKTEVVLTDMPGQNLPEFKAFEKDVSLIENLNCLGYRVTFLHPISHRKDCVEDYLQELCDYFDNQVDYAIAKNHYFGDQFPYYDGSQLQAKIKKLNGLELVLSNLHSQCYQQVEDAALSYSKAVLPESPLNVIYRSIVFNWMEDFLTSITSNDTASNYLGLNVKQLHSKQLEPSSASDILPVSTEVSVGVSEPPVQTNSSNQQSFSPDEPEPEKW